MLGFTVCIGQAKIPRRYDPGFPCDFWSGEESRTRVKWGCGFDVVRGKELPSGSAMGLRPPFGSAEDLRGAAPMDFVRPLAAAEDLPWGESEVGLRRSLGPRVNLPTLSRWSSSGFMVGSDPHILQDFLRHDPESAGVLVPIP